MNSEGVFSGSVQRWTGLTVSVAATRLKRCLSVALINGTAQVASVLLPWQHAPVYKAEPTIDAVSDELSDNVAVPCHLRLHSAARHRYHTACPSNDIQTSILPRSEATQL